MYWLKQLAPAWQAGAQCQTWLDVIAEQLLGCHALVDKGGIQPDVICTLHLLPEQLALALHGQAALLLQL